MKSGNIQRWNWQNLMTGCGGRERGIKGDPGSSAIMAVRVPGLFPGIGGTTERAYLDCKIMSSILDILNFHCL